MTKLDEIIEMFQSVDTEMRLQLLLDYARRLPPLPERFRAMRDAGLNRVPECQTPVFLLVEPDEQDAVRIHVDVAEEAPTVKGFLCILITAFNGATGEQISGAPDQLLKLLGLADTIRMTRAVGLSAILARMKRQAVLVAGSGASGECLAHDAR